MCLYGKERRMGIYGAANRVFNPPRWQTEEEEEEEEEPRGTHLAGTIAVCGERHRVDYVSPYSQNPAWVNMRYKGPQHADLLETGAEEQRLPRMLMSAFERLRQVLTRLQSGNSVDWGHRNALKHYASELESEAARRGGQCEREIARDTAAALRRVFDILNTTKKELVKALLKRLGVETAALRRIDKSPKNRVPDEIKALGVDPAALRRILDILKISKKNLVRDEVEALRKRLGVESSASPTRLRFDE